MSWVLGHVEKGLDWNIKLISKFMASQPVKQTIAIQILPNILRNKDNQRMKLG